MGAFFNKFKRKFIFRNCFLFNTFYCYTVYGDCSRFYNISHFIPVMFIVSSVFSGFNFSLFMVFFIYFGVYSLLTTTNLKNLTKSILFFHFWVFNASNSFYLPSKLRGFSSVLYDFNSVLAWTIITFLIIMEHTSFTAKVLNF